MRLTNYRIMYLLYGTLARFYASILSMFKSAKGTLAHVPSVGPLSAPHRPVLSAAASGRR